MAPPKVGGPVRQNQGTLKTPEQKMHNGKMQDQNPGKVTRWKIQDWKMKDGK